jgi:hypothetical protein
MRWITTAIKQIWFAFFDRRKDTRIKTQIDRIEIVPDNKDIVGEIETLAPGVWRMQRIKKRKIRR